MFNLTNVVRIFRAGINLKAYTVRYCCHNGVAYVHFNDSYVSYPEVVHTFEGTLTFLPQSVSLLKKLKLGDADSVEHMTIVTDDNDDQFLCIDEVRLPVVHTPDIVPHKEVDITTLELFQLDAFKELSGLSLNTFSMWEEAYDTFRMAVNEDLTSLVLIDITELGLSCDVLDLKSASDLISKLKYDYVGLTSSGELYLPSVVYSKDLQCDFFAPPTVALSLCPVNFHRLFTLGYTDTLDGKKYVLPDSPTAKQHADILCVDFTYHSVYTTLIEVL